ncbi:MAG: hydrogenase nickel incorporation protein HypB, partial [Actinomycetota bacterium]|nr:hydrogenase nickel incorporation protein HypB [Actinomycetota bacterium]
MGRFHRHADGTVHQHDHAHEHDGDHGPDDRDHGHDHDHGHRDVGDHTGYPETGTDRVAVLETILAENDRTADRNRADFER